MVSSDRQRQFRGTRRAAFSLGLAFVVASGCDDDAPPPAPPSAPAPPAPAPPEPCPVEPGPPLAAPGPDPAHPPSTAAERASPPRAVAPRAAPRGRRAHACRPEPRRGPAAQRCRATHPGTETRRLSRGHAAGRGQLLPGGGATVPRAPPGVRE